jgi:predicted CXXCH cytochrome family protein
MRRAFLLLGTASLLIGLFLLPSRSLLANKKDSARDIAAIARYVTIPGAKSVGSEACIACHAEVSGNYRHAHHSLVGVECEDCHGNGSLHVEAGGDVTKIFSYGKHSARDANGACMSCHAQDESIRHFTASKHMSSGVRCMDCHHVHAQKQPGKLGAAANFDTASLMPAKSTGDLVPESKVFLESRRDSTEACLQCHQTQRGEMSLPYHHPLREGKLACVDCHDPHGGTNGKNLRASSINELCLSCHAQYRGPFAYQHPPVNENCLTCHLPHGSPNTNLLTLSQPALCLQCHSGHHNGSSLPLADRCSSCHNSVHGTDVPSATGGSVFVDKGSYGVPKTPVQPPAPAISAATARRSASSVHPAMLPAVAAVPASAAALGSASSAAGAGGIAGLLAWMSENAPSSSGTEPSETALSYTDYFFAPAYRFVSTSGFAGRVGEYDSLQQSFGGDADLSWVSVPHRLSILAHASVLTADDYRITSRVGYSDVFQLGFNARSFVQQQDTYPFYASVISPDIVTSDGIPSGSVYGVKRRLGDVSARVKLPTLPVHLFVKGNWQARVGQCQLAYLDMAQDTAAGACQQCHYTSQFQSMNYTTRNVGGGADVKIWKILATYEHDYSSFNDRLQYPVGTYGSTTMSTEPTNPFNVADTPPGNYYLGLPSPNTSSTDSLRLSWPILSQLMFLGDVSYSRLTNSFTNFPQNWLNANTTFTWSPLERLRLIADYHQQNVINNFTPFYSLYGNTSYHNHSVGIRGEYDLTSHLDVEARYEHGGISRSNTALWPQAYSPNNLDVLYVVPSSTSNTTGLALRYHSGQLWSARVGYNWTGTQNPGYITVPGSNNRIVTNVVVSPAAWLSFSNDANFIIQNAFPAVQRSNRFYTETAAVSLHPRPLWDIEFGYSYQQDNLATFMRLMNDPAVNYVLDEPLVPYRQLSQTYWVQWGTQLLHQKLGFTARYTYNSARSVMNPDLNPNDAAKLGNASLIQNGTFDQDLFSGNAACAAGGTICNALQALQLGSTQVSQVIIPEQIGQAKLYYLFPRQISSGLIFSYGSYHDVWNPNLDGVLRTFSFFVGRKW